MSVLSILKITSMISRRAKGRADRVFTLVVVPIAPHSTGIRKFAEPIPNK